VRLRRRAGNRTSALQIKGFQDRDGGMQGCEQTIGCSDMIQGTKEAYEWGDGKNAWSPRSGDYDYIPLGSRQNGARGGA
jgi:hypothetical protein